MAAGQGKSAAEFWRDYSKGLTHEQRLAQVRFVARMMDDQFGCPAPRSASASIPFSAFSRARRRGDQRHLAPHRASRLAERASKLVLARMLGNVGVDFLIGSVPIVGDLFDFAWKANRRNARLLEAHLNRRSGKWEVR